MTKNKLIIILSVLVACLFVALLYLLSLNNQKTIIVSTPTPTPTPTPIELKLYRHFNPNFEFFYYQNLSFKPNPEKVSNLISIDQVFNDDVWLFNIYTDNKFNGDIANWIKTNIPQDASLETEFNISYSLIHAYLGPSWQPNNWYVFFDKSNLVVFETHGMRAERYDDLKHIFSTFSFFSPSPIYKSKTSIPAGWQLYESNKNDFSFAYPQNWFYSGGVLSNYDIDKIGDYKKGFSPKDVKCDLVDGLFPDIEYLTNKKTISQETANSYHIIRGKLGSDVPEFREAWRSIPVTVYQIGDYLNYFVCFSLPEDQLDTVDKIVNTFRLSYDQK